MLFRLENNQKTQSFYMCTSELGAGREKNASYAVFDRSCTRLGARSSGHRARPQRDAPSFVLRSPQHSARPRPHEHQFPICVRAMRYWRPRIQHVHDPRIRTGEPGGWVFVRDRANECKLVNLNETIWVKFGGEVR